LLERERERETHTHTHTHTFLIGSGLRKEIFPSSLGSHLGFNLDMKEVDEFLIGRIIKKYCDIGDHCDSI